MLWFIWNQENKNQKSNTLIPNQSHNANAPHPTAIIIVVIMTCLLVSRKSRKYDRGGQERPLTTEALSGQALIRFLCFLFGYSRRVNE